MPKKSDDEAANELLAVEHQPVLAKQQPKKLRLSINPHLINKNAAGDAALFVEGWENDELTIEELAAKVSKGVAYTAQLGGKRKSANFRASDVVSVDIDQGMTIEQARANPLVAGHAGLIYTTASHTAEAPRLRIVYPLPRTVTDPREMRALARSLALRLSGDPAATDATRISFGNRGAEIWLPGGELSVELMEELIAQSMIPPAPDGPNGGVLVAVRSALIISNDRPIRLADGWTLPLSRIATKTPVHCPFHTDEHPSAFVVRNEHGQPGIHCSCCKSTFWSAEGDEGQDFYRFDRKVKEALEHFQKHHDPGRQLGKFFDYPDTQIGLVDCNIRLTEREPAPPELLLGLNLIKSPKGSGKTQSLAHLIADARSVLLVGHRRSLIRQSCARLGLHCYLDDDGLPAGKLRWAQERYGVCLDSLGRLPPRVFKHRRGFRYGVLIIDESEQVLGHVLADTVGQHGGSSREAVFGMLKTLVKRSKHVVALDADLGFVTYQTLTRMKAPALPDPAQGDLFDKKKPAVHLWLNERKPGLGKTVQVFRSKQHLLADLMQAAADGRRIFVTANSKSLINDISALISDRLPQVKHLVVTADTVAGKEQKAFLENAQEKTLEYQVVLTSPAAGTGIDITFPNREQHVDVVYGFCEANITTHFDFDQQLGRVRDPGAVKVWVNPRRFHFETNFDVVRHELLDQGLVHRLLVDRNGKGPVEYGVNDDPMTEMAAMIVSQQRASKNALRDNFIDHKQRQGYEVELIEPAGAAKAAGRALLAAGRRLGGEKYVEKLLGSPPLGRREHAHLTAAIEAGKPVADAEWWSLQRTKIELFYRQPVTAELALRDDGGRWRQRVILLDEVECAAKSKEAQKPLDSATRFIRARKEIAPVIARLLKLTPVISGMAWDTDAVFDGDHLASFVRFVSENKAALENLLGIEVRRDVGKKPMSQLRAVLRLIGLGLAAAGTMKIGGRKIYRYRIDPEPLDQIKSVQAARMRTTAWLTMAEIHGWPAEREQADDFDDED